MKAPNTSTPWLRRKIAPALLVLLGMVLGNLDRITGQVRDDVHALMKEYSQNFEDTQAEWNDFSQLTRHGVEGIEYADPDTILPPRPPMGLPISGTKKEAPQMQDLSKAAPLLQDPS